MISDKNIERGKYIAQRVFEMRSLPKQIRFLFATKNQPLTLIPKPALLFLFGQACLLCFRQVYSLSLLFLHKCLVIMKKEYALSKAFLLIK